MRKALLALLPLTTLVVMAASFFLLNQQHIAQQSLVNSSVAAASTVRNPVTPRVPSLPAIKVSSIAATSPSPTIVSTITPSPSAKQRAKPTPLPLEGTTKGPTTVVTPTPTKSAQISVKSTPPLNQSTPTPTPTKPGPTITTAAIKSSPAKQGIAAVQGIKTKTTSGDEVKSYIQQRINDYRSSLGLSTVSSNSNTCDFAKTRAFEIVQNFSHEGFINRVNSHTLPYSSYHEISENIAMNSDYKQIVAMWISSPSHAENMRRDTPFVCVEANGDYYAYEGWKP